MTTREAIIERHPVEDIEPEVAPEELSRAEFLRGVLVYLTQETGSGYPLSAHTMRARVLVLAFLANPKLLDCGTAKEFCDRYKIGAPLYKHNRRQLFNCLREL